MRRRVKDLDADSGEVFYTIEEDDEPIFAVLSRTFGAARHSVAPITPRLLSDKQAAEYLTVSRSAVRSLVANRTIRRVELPSTDGHGGTARLLRIDRQDLDALIEKWKG